jgi:hypothetical protein
MYTAHRFEGTYTRPLIEPPAPWPRGSFAEPDVLEIEPGDLKAGSHLVGSLAATHLGQIKAASAQSEKVTRQSPLYIHDYRDRVKARFRLLRRLPADHDNEGAAAAQLESVDAAIAFVDQVQAYPAPFYATLDDEGSAVIEFEDRGTGFFADVTFRGKDEVVCYVRQPNSPSQLIEGQRGSRPIRHFLSSQMQLIL